MSAHPRSRRNPLEGLPCKQCGKPSADGWFCVECWNAKTPAQQEQWMDQQSRKARR